MSIVRSKVDLSRSQAVLVGVSAYTGGFRDEPIPAAANGLHAMEGALTRDCGWPADRIATFADRTSGSEFINAVGPLISNAADVLLVYYVGHGQLLPENDELGLALTDTSKEPRLRAATSWRFRDLLSEMRSSPASVKIIILDCCLSGLALRALDWNNDGLRPRSGNMSPGEGTYVLTACGHTEETYFEPGESGMPHFTRAVTWVIRSGIVGAPHWMTPLDVYDAAKEVIGRRDPNVPEPLFAFLGGKPDFPLAENASAQSRPMGGRRMAPPAETTESAPPAASRHWLAGIDINRRARLENPEPLPAVSPPKPGEVTRSRVGWSLFRWLVLWFSVSNLLLWWNWPNTWATALYGAGSAVLVWSVVNVLRGHSNKGTILAAFFVVVGYVVYLVVGFANRHYLNLLWEPVWGIIYITAQVTISGLPAMPAAKEPLADEDRLRVDPLGKRLAEARWFGKPHRSALVDELAYLPSARFVDLWEKLGFSARREFAVLCGDHAVLFYHFDWAAGTYVLSGSIRGEIRRDGALDHEAQQDLDAVQRDFDEHSRILAGMAEVRGIVVVAEGVHARPYGTGTIEAMTEGRAAETAGPFLAERAYHVNIRAMRKILDHAGELEPHEVMKQVNELFWGPRTPSPSGPAWRPLRPWPRRIPGR